MRGRHHIAVIFLLALFIISGCGYHVTSKTGRLPEGIKSLTIPIFENRTAKPDIESDVTSAFVDEFVTSARMESGAGHVMNGIIKTYELTPVSFTKSDINQEYRLTVVLGLSIVEKVTGRVIWQEDNITDYEDFTVNIDDVTETTEREEAALQKLARDTARLVKERMIERF